MVNVKLEEEDKDRESEMRGESTLYLNVTR